MSIVNQKINNFNMNDLNSQNNSMPQDQNNLQSNPVDPNFLPKDSNVYIRTMNADLNNLKNQGGETLPYVENPVSASNFGNLETQNTPSFTMPEAPKPAEIPPVEMPKMPEAMPTFEMPVAPVEMPKAPEMPSVEVPVNNSFSAPAQEVPSFGAQVNLNENPNTLNDIKEKINALNETPEVKMENPGINNLSANLDGGLNNLITPEEFTPMSNVDINGGEPPKKNKTILIIGVVSILAFVLLFVFVIRPKMLSPKVSLKNVNTPDALMQPTVPETVTTTKPSPFMMLKGGFQLDNVDIDISKSPEIVSQIKEEANNLLSPNSFKVIISKVKNQYLTSQEILNAFVDNAPVSLANNLDEKYLVYSFYGEVHPALGLVFKVKPEAVEQIKTEFKAWETNRNIIKNTMDIWLFSPKTPTTKTFKDAESLGATIRHFDYPGKEASLAYAFFENNVIISTSLESINSAINYLQNGDTPIIR